MHTLKALTCGLVISLGATRAQADDAEDLLYAMGMRELVQIMHLEGLDYGESLATELFPDSDGPAWDATVARIHDIDLMEQSILAEYKATLGDTDVSDMLAFFRDGPGRGIVELEVEARRAMVDPAVEEAARDAYDALVGTSTARLVQLEGFVAANDLIEANVMGAMNASFNFYSGLAEGGAFEMSEGDIIRDVWAQEDSTRQDTNDWVYSFLLMAYGPLEDETLDAHIALAQTDAGQAVNRALFAGFNKMYDDLSYALGLAAARHMLLTDL